MEEMGRQRERLRREGTQGQAEAGHYRERKRTVYAELRRNDDGRCENQILQVFGPGGIRTCEYWMQMQKNKFKIDVDRPLRSKMVYNY